MSDEDIILVEPNRRRATQWAQQVVELANKHGESNPIANLARCYLEADGERFRVVEELGFWLVHTEDCEAPLRPDCTCGLAAKLKELSK